MTSHGSGRATDPVPGAPGIGSPLEQFRAILAEHQRKLDEIVARANPAPILTLTEAIAYTKHESASAFYRWCAKWRVTACAQGRYARGQLDRAMQREAATRRLPRNGDGLRASSADKSRPRSSAERGPTKKAA